MNDLITIKNVRGRMGENGIAQLNLEDVARGLGFTEVKDEKEYIRWRTVNAYLSEFHFSQKVAKGEFSPFMAKDGFIPENIFYKLCFKASNETARAFQDLVTDEILPTIRKHGAYMTTAKLEEIMNDPDAWITVLTALKTEREQRQQLEQKVEADAPKVELANAVTVSDDCILIRDMAKILYQNGTDTGGNRLYEWLRRNGYLSACGADYNRPTQKAMNLKLFKIQEEIIRRPNVPDITRLVTYVTGKGQLYFINKFKGVSDLMKFDKIAQLKQGGAE